MRVAHEDGWPGGGWCYTMGGRGATGVGQNTWEHGRRVRAASGCLARVKHERGRGRKRAQLQFDIVLPPCMLIPLAHILSQLTPRLTRCPHPSLSPHPTSHGLARRLAAETCTSHAQTNRAGVWAGEHVGVWAGERVGVRAGERVGVWAGEHVGVRAGERVGVRAGERVGDWRNEGAHEWVGMWACERTKPAEVWADEHVGRPADRTDR